MQPGARYELALRGELKGLLREQRKRGSKPDFVICEVGVCRCVRSIEMITAAQGFGRQVIFYGFDLFEEGNQDLNRREHNLKRPMTLREAMDALCRLGAHIFLSRGDTRETIPLAANTMIPLDFLFIDGGHSLATIRSDWRYLGPLVKSDGVAVLDDYYEERLDFGCKPLVDGLSPGWRVELLEPAESFPATGPMRMAKVTRARR